MDLEIFFPAFVILATVCSVVCLILVCYLPTAYYDGDDHFGMKSCLVAIGISLFLSCAFITIAYKSSLDLEKRLHHRCLVETSL